MIRPILVVLLLTGPLVACGGDDTADPVSSTSVSPTQSTATGETPTSITTGQAPTVVPLAVAPCSLLTVDDVAAATGLPAADGMEDGPISCTFRLTGAGASIFVAVDDGDGRMVGPAALYDGYLAEDGEVVAGIGGRWCPPRRSGRSRSTPVVGTSTRSA